MKYFKKFENFPSVNGMYDQGATGALNRYANENPAIEFEENIKDDYVILYRGDSQKIDKHLSDLFDQNSLFGPGLYLTDDYDVAYTYTTKGDDKAVLFRIHFDNISYVNNNGYVKYDNPLQYCKNMFIVEYLIPKITNNFDEYELHDFSEIITNNNYIDIINIKSEEDLFFLKYRKELDKTASWYNKEYLLKEITFYNKICTYFIIAYKLFNNKYSNVKFIPQQLTDKDNVYKAIMPDLIEGEVYKFKINKHILDKCFDTDNKYTGSFFENLIKNSIKKVLLQYNKNEKYKKNFNEIYKNAEYYFKDSICDNIYPIKSQMSYLGNTYLKMFWQLIISELQKQGYKGFKYNGGVMTGNKYHNAYSIWNMDDVLRIK